MIYLYGLLCGALGFGTSQLFCYFDKLEKVELINKEKLREALSELMGVDTEYRDLTYAESKNIEVAEEKITKLIKEYK